MNGAAVTCGLVAALAGLAFAFMDDTLRATAYIIAALVIIPLNNIAAALRERR
jgi:MFS-type transporter involved in bile tolerance (Atg22 family)